MVAVADLLAPHEAARLLKVTPQRVAQLAKAGKLPFEQTPLGRVYHRTDVEALRLQRQGPPAPEVA